jgi:hypothetical protein
MNHSTSKRIAKAAPQVESTMLVEGITAKIVKCKARKAFKLGNASIQENETFFLVKSERRINRYYVVHFSNICNTYICSDGCGACEHEHLKVVREYVVRTIVAPAKGESSEVIPMTTPATVKEVKARRASKTPSTNYAEIAATRALTAEEWKSVQKDDRARQRAWASEYRQAAEALHKVRFYP